MEKIFQGKTLETFQEMPILLERTIAKQFLLPNLTLAPLSSSLMPISCFCKIIYISIVIK